MGVDVAAAGQGLTDEGVCFVVGAGVAGVDADGPSEGGGGVEARFIAIFEAASRNNHGRLKNPVARSATGDHWSDGEIFRCLPVQGRLSSAGYFCSRYFLAVATFMYSRRS
jgi:hypothetical protein